MSKLNLLAGIAIAIMLSGSVDAAGPRGGGGGGGGRGGGGAPHMGGGGGAHFGGGGGGGMRGGGMRMGGAPRFAGGGARFSGGGARFSGGGGRHFSARPAISSRSAAQPGFRGNRSYAIRNAPNIPGGSVNRRANFDRNFNTGQNPNFRQNRNAALRTNAVRSALNSRAVAGALRNRSALHNPGARALIVASAATAGWRHGRDGNGWWRHSRGGYGWVGPLFWPFAYYDMYDYTLWGNGYDASFWDYGYNDIYAGLFAPYGYDALSGYVRQGAAQASTASGAAANPAQASDQLSQMCGEDSRDIAGLPIDRIQAAISPNDAQRAALDDLANASVKAAQDLKAACPTQISLTAPSRLAAMQARIEAMIAAANTVQTPLDKFYGLLTDEQKARLNALGQDQSKRDVAAAAGGPAAQSCGATQPGVTNWPAAEIEATLHPTEAQRASLTALQDASAKAVEMLKASCQNDTAVTPPARLAAVSQRLDVMLQAVKTVRTALDDFYGQLTDEQKAQFEAIGPRRTNVSDRSGQSATAQTRSRRHHVGIPGIMRRIMSMVR